MKKTLLTSISFLFLSTAVLATDYTGELGPDAAFTPVELTGSNSFASDVNVHDIVTASDNSIRSAVFVTGDGTTTIANGAAFEDNTNGHDAGRGGVFSINSTDSVLNIGNLGSGGSVLFEGNQAYFGGAIWNGDGKVNIVNARFVSNTATYYGGAIYNSGNTTDDDSLIITSGVADNTAPMFYKNTATTSGGAIYNDGWLTLAVENAAGGNTMTFKENSANEGGAIYNINGILTINRGVVFDTNSSTSTSGAGGGAINNGGTVTITDAAFKNNTSQSQGGAIYNGGTVMITSTLDDKLNPMFFGNQAQNLYEGGAIYNAGALTFTVNEDKSITFKQNSAVRGGAIYNDTASNVTLVKGLIFNTNSAGGFGGAIYNALGTMFINDVIFKNNTAVTGGGAINNLDTITINATLDDTLNPVFFGNTAANGGAIYNDSVLNFTVADGATMTFKGNGGIGYGGAIYATRTGNLNLVNGMIFDENTAGFGGAIYFNGTTLGNINGVVFKNNTATTAGGAIHNEESLNISGSTFLNNKANIPSGISLGGAIYNKGTMEITDSVFKENQTTAQGYGGAINNDGTMTITSSTDEGLGNGSFQAMFEENKSTAYGGAIYNNGTLTLSVTGADQGNTMTFYNNSASVGGAIYNAFGTLTATSGVVFDTNTSFGGWGGAIFNNATATFTGAVFKNNTTSSDGGAIYNIGTMTVTDSFFKNNEARSGMAGYGGKGGAIYNALGTMTITSTTDEGLVNGSFQAMFDGNKGIVSGGAIYNNNTLTLNVDPSGSGNTMTFKENEAGQGGAIYNTYAGVVNIIGNVNFFDNTASYLGGAIYNDGELNLTGADNTIINFNRNTINGNGNDIHNTTNGTINISGGVNISITGGISGEGNIVKSGTGHLILDGNNADFTGTFTQTAGEVFAFGSFFNGENNINKGDLYLNEDMTFNHLKIGNEGNVFLSSPIGNATTTIGNLEGDGGNIWMRTTLGDDGSPSDVLIIGGAASGNTVLNIVNDGGAGTLTTGNGILLVGTVNDGRTTEDAFTLKHGQVDVGAYSYDLFRGAADGTNDDAWFLRSTDLSPTFHTMTNVPTLQLSMAVTGLNSLHKRMGDLRQNCNDNTYGVWARSFGKFLSAKDGIKTDMNMVALEAGVDTRVDVKSGALFVGAMAGYMDTASTKSKANGMKVSSGDGYAPSVGLYATYLQDCGWYVDVTGRVFWSKLDMRAFPIGGTPESYKPSRLMAGTSVEVGRQIVWEALVFEPGIKLSYIYGESDKTSVGNDTLKYDATNSLRLRLGSTVGWDIENWPVTPFVDVGVSQEFLGKTDVFYAGAKNRSDLSGFGYDVGAGVNASVSDAVSLYGQVSYEHAEKVMGLGFNAGLRVGF